MIKEDMSIIYEFAKLVYSKIRQVDAVTQIQPKLIEWKFNSNSFVVFVQLCVICLMELNTHVELAQT